MLSAGKKDKITEKRFCGSYTVEAVFVMPIILFLLFGIIYVAFYLHDEVILQTVVSKYLQRIQDDMIASKHADEETLEKETMQLFLQEGKEWLCITSVSSTDMEYGVLKVDLSFLQKQKIHLPLPGILSSEEKKRSFHSLIYDPAENLRCLGGVLKNENGV